jgi:hypothetical protein
MTCWWELFCNHWKLKISTMGMFHIHADIWHALISSMSRGWERKDRGGGRDRCCCTTTKKDVLMMMIKEA